MTPELALPIKATSFATVRFGLPIVMFIGSFVAFVFWFGLRNIATPMGYVGIPAVFVAIFDFILPAIWLKSQRPAHVVINSTTLTITTMPIMGLGGGKITQRSLSEFERIDALFSIGLIDRAERIMFRGKPDHKDVTLDVKFMKSAIPYAKQLGDFFNLPVIMRPLFGSTKAVIISDIVSTLGRGI